MDDGIPRVSIIVPCYNEEATIELLLSALKVQDYPVSDMEIIIADGLSSDNTRAKVNSYQQLNPEMSIHLIDNPRRIIPTALNRAISQAKGDYIIRLDAHSIPEPDYIKRCVQMLEAGVAENIGGVWKILPKTEGWISRSIAAAASHPVGVGDARYRYGGQAGFVDTVPFGSFKREIFDQIGLFDENLLANEDYEFNARIRANGGRIWFDPNIQSVYFARGDFLSLLKQYFRYGYWKWKMLQAYPNTLRLRQAMPPLFVITVILLLLVSLWLEIARYLFVFLIGCYFLILMIASLPIAIKKRSPFMLIGIPVAVAIMHFSWGSGILWSMVKSLIRG